MNILMVVYNTNLDKNAKRLDIPTLIDMFYSIREKPVSIEEYD